MPKAEYAVGYYCEMGIGVRQDLEEARRWYLRAAAQGNKRSMQRLTEMKRGVDPGGAGAGKARGEVKNARSAKVSKGGKDEACSIM